MSGCSEKCTGEISSIPFGHTCIAEMIVYRIDLGFSRSFQAVVIRIYIYISFNAR